MKIRTKFILFWTFRKISIYHHLVRKLICLKNHHRFGGEIDTKFKFSVLKEISPLEKKTSFF